MKNPQTAIDAILSEGEEGFVKRMTLARMALLEKVDCPILRNELPDRLQMVHLLYIMTAPAEELRELAGDAEALKLAAFDWAESIDDFSKVQSWMTAIFQDLSQMTQMAPKSNEEGTGKKKAQTAG